MSERGSSRGRWCKLRRKPKYGMPAIDDAWRTAWEMFAYDGRILTPYWCSMARIYGVRSARYVGNKNPWAFRPVAFLVGLRHLTRLNRDHGKACRLWHLTTSTTHLLPARATTAQAEKGPTG